MIPLHFGVIGDPVAHSKSPGMHAAAYRALGLPHTYEAIRVTTAELPRVIDRLRAGELAGLNVTVPHKRAVLALADEADAIAHTARASNTLFVEHGRVHATNTDAPALEAELADMGLAEGIDRALVLGSGGAARAAIVALRTAKEIVVRARDASKVTGELAPVVRGRLVAEPLVASSTDAFDCVVQTTSAGMTGADAGEAIARAVDWTKLEGAVVLETIYSPAETPFLKAARAHGLRAENGFGMLARQGALALELWLGVAAPLQVMRDALMG